jgi:hypothetical protein
MKENPATNDNLELWQIIPRRETATTINLPIEKAIFSFLINPLKLWRGGGEGEVSGRSKNRPGYN